MVRARWMLVAGVLSGLAASSTAQAQIKGRWLGQDRHDYCGEVTGAIKPNGVQDVHIALSGLPTASEITFAKITGHGADEWQYRGVQNQFGAVILRKPGAATADVYFEPLRVETGREFCVSLKFDNGSAVDVFLKGGKANPNLRMAGSAMALKWIGQEKVDHAGAGPGVGPDGLQDARIAVSKLAAKDRVKSILVEGPSRSRWMFGTNPDGFPNAEFLPRANDPTEGGLYFHPDRDLSGQRLKVTVTYESGKQDTSTVVAGRTDPRLAMPRSALPKLGALALKSRWLGQDGGASTGPGDVHVSVSGLPASRAIAAAVLSDPVRGVWAFRAGDRPGLDVDPHAAPLAFRRGSDRTSADLSFAPVRDESNTPMTLRVVYQDGESAVATIPGGPCDPGRRAPAVEPTEVAARPGDDLAGLVGRFGTVRLAKGDYRLTRPLVLSRPVTVVGEPGAVLTFAQGPGEAPWTAAIKIHAGGTTLRGFAVRFAGPVRWRNDVSYGPAVIGTTDNFDTGPNAPKVNLTFDHLDLEGPPSSRSKPWEEAPKLLRLVNAAGGRVVGNVLRGGVIELFEGPWLIENNEYRGTPPGTFTSAVFGVHEPHDVVVRNNKAKPVGTGGKTWRFLLFTNRGCLDRVENNTIEGIGPRDDDTIPADNQPEIILTESYHLRFEGKPSAVSADGRLVKVGALRGEPPRTGDVVSVLSGAGAGQWRRIAQRVEPTVYLLDAPLPRGAEVVSISPGFVHEVFAGNTIDARGGRAAAGFVLAGNHFGTRLLKNRVIGAGDALQLMAFPSESPGIWGWSHAPFLGGVVEGNTVEDSERGGQIGVLHNEHVKSSKGRVYMTLALKGNTVRWTEPFLSRLARTPAKGPAAGITLGYPGSLDPGEMVVEESGNRLEAPARVASGSALKVRAATVNGRAGTGR